MRTTLTIEDDLAESIEQLRAAEKTSYRETINRLLRAGLMAVKSPPTTRRYRGPTFDMGLHPGIDPNRMNQLVDELDAEEFNG
jgi:hypothetical protein